MPHLRKERVIIKLKGIVRSTLKSLHQSLRRFPITIAVSTTLVIMIIIITEMRTGLYRGIIEMLERISMTLALGIPLSLCIKIIFEKKNVKTIVQGLVYTIGSGILVLYYFFMLKDFSMVSITRYIGVSIFLYLAFLYLPWVGNKENYEYYIIKVFSSFFLTVIYSAVLYLGLAAIIFSVENLFEVNIKDEIYFYMFLVVSGIFAPSLFLAKIPKNNYKFLHSDYPKALKILLLYIVIPLIIVYTAILYAYFVKIIVTTNWPVGLVSHLVLWYSVISVGVIFLIFPVLHENKLAKSFTFWFPKVIIPIVIMMFVSMGIRIKAYGITENRYFVLVLGLWVLAIMLYFTFTKKYKSIIIPISISIVVLNSVFGPLSSYSISKISQNNRLENILARNNMLKNGEIIKAPTDISTKDKTEISMILQYFNTNHSLKDVKYLPDDFELKEIESVFGFPFTNYIGTVREDYFYYSSLNRDGRALEISGYDYFIDMNALLNKAQIENSIQGIYDASDNTFKILDGENIIYIKELEDYGKKIHDKYKDLDEKPIDEKGNIAFKDMTFTDENEKVKVMYIFNHVSGIDKIDEIEINNLDFNVLVKLKE